MSDNALVGIDMATVDSEFESWWESDGQYCRSGGGVYEKTFAYRAYEAAIAKANSFYAPMVNGFTAIDMGTAAADGRRSLAEYLIKQIAIEHPGQHTLLAVEHIAQWIALEAGL